MNGRITFARLEKVLVELGFQKRVVPNEGVAYHRSATQSSLVVSVHKPNEFVPDYVLASIRHQLDAQGVITARALKTCSRRLPHSSVGGCWQARRWGLQICGCIDQLEITISELTLESLAKRIEALERLLHVQPSEPPPPNDWRGGGCFPAANS